MNRTKLGSLLCAAVLVAPALGAEFMIFHRERDQGEIGRVTETLLRIDPFQFVLVPPAGWKVSSDAVRQQLNWGSHDLAGLITLTVRTNEQRESLPRLDAAGLEELLRQRFPQTVLKETLPCYSGGAGGLAFDLDEDAGNGLRLTRRVAFIPFHGGMAELLLTTTPQYSTLHQHAFSSLLHSFRPTTGDESN